jgi:glycine betaine/proline transport system ATP-binding protein
MPKVKIKVENLIKIFGDHPKKALEMLKKGADKNEVLNKTGNAIGVNDVSFEVFEGEILVVMGLSGSGKSTLIRCLNRLIEPTAGKIYVDERDITSITQEQLRELRRKKFGMVFQRFALLPHRTVLKNVEYGLEVQGIDPGSRDLKAREALKLVGLEGWEEQYPSHLSGGMQQRVGLARALAIDPDILLMDEAFSALDPLIKREMQDELISLHGSVSKTIVFITHDLDEAIKIGDRIILMKDGRVVQQGTPEEILTNPSNEYVEKFVENVDMSKVLTAQKVMKKVISVGFLKDGPRTLLRKMEDTGISSIYIVDSGYRIKGIVFAEEAADAVEKGEKNIENIMEKEVKTVGMDTPINDILPLMVDIRYPMAVVDEGNRLKGVIIRGSILAGLTRRGRQQ